MDALPQEAQLALTSFLIALAVGGPVALFGAATSITWLRRIGSFMVRRRLVTGLLASLLGGAGLFGSGLADVGPDMVANLIGTFFRLAGALIRVDQIKTDGPATIIAVVIQVGLVTEPGNQMGMQFFKNTLQGVRIEGQVQIEDRTVCDGNFDMPALLRARQHQSRPVASARDLDCQPE